MNLLTRLSITGFVSILALTANACPTFNGTYRCKTDSQDKTVTLRTAKVSGVTQYTLDDSQILADGKYRKVRYEGGDYDMAGVCKDQTLSLKVKFEGGAPGESACGAQKWDVLYILSWTPKGNDIAEHTSGATLCADGKEIPNDISDDFVCVKQ